MVEMADFMEAYAARMTPPDDEGDTGRRPRKGSSGGGVSIDEL